MFSFLNSPTPCFIGQKENMLTAVFIGLFVMLFLIVFQPFGISNNEFSDTVINSAGFGLVSFLVQVFFYFVVPKILPKYFDEKDYTLGKDILAYAFMLLILGLVNGVYARFMFSESAQEFISIGGMIGQTFLIGIFPISFLSLLQHSQSNKSNIEASRDIRLSKEKASFDFQDKKALFFTISTDQEKTSIGLNDLLFLESNGNYIKLNQMKDEGFTTSMHRATLKSVEAENTYKNIIRCHRSYIVNLDQVLDVQGNAQGLKLKLKNCNEDVPVSRKYISTVKDYFNQ